AARAKDVDRVMNKAARPPKYLQRNRVIDLDHAPGEETPGVYKGLPTSSGICTGTARVVRLIDDIGKVHKGENLVTNSTDPGWASVFVVASAVVTETGGMLSHASCLTREYGMPSVQLPNAMDLIPDGATITIDGDLGTITIVDEEPQTKP